MKSAAKFFNADEKARIADAVGEAERETSAEIVPVLATASGRYDRAEDLFGIVFALVSLALIWWRYQGVRPAAGDWALGQVFVLPLWAIVLIVVVAFSVGVALASRFTILRLPFATAKEMREEVERSAVEAFRSFRVRKTAGGTGVLIYVSLFERMVRVVPDQSIEDRFEAQDWEAVCQLVVNGLKEGRSADGFAAAIRKCGEILASEFPIAEGDVDELDNQLRVID